MRKTIAVLTALLGLSLALEAQTNTNTAPVAPAPASTIVGTLEQYLTVNDPTYNGWQSNHFTVFEAAVFQNVDGVPGASAVGNVLGLEVPVYRTATKLYDVHLESLTDFETVFGNVGWLAAGVAVDCNLHQIQLSAGLDVNLALQGPMTAQAAPFIEFKKASTQLNGASPIFRYEVPIRSRAGAGMFIIGVQVPL